MIQRHLKFDLPNQPPFDRQDWWWQAYGDIVLPLSGGLSRFWFSRYGALNQNPYILLRYEVEEELTEFPLEPSEHKEFDIVADLSGERFFGTNQRFLDAKQRGDMIFDFLHQTARLTLSQLSHKDKDGYWRLESSSDRGNNHFGSPMESVHHLFCNSSATPVGIALAHIQQSTDPKDLIFPCGLIQAKNSGLMKPDTQVVRIEH